MLSGIMVEYGTIRASSAYYRTHHSEGRVDSVHVDVLTIIPVLVDIVDGRELLGMMDHLLSSNTIASRHSLSIGMVVRRRGPADRDRAGVSSQAQTAIAAVAKRIPRNRAGKRGIRLIQS